MQATANQILASLGAYVPNFIAALAILLFGWLLALILSAIVRGGLRRTTLDERLAGWLAGDDAARGVKVEEWAGKIVYYLVLVFVLIAFFQVLGLTAVTEPLNQLLIQVLQYLPQLLGAGLLLLVAWIVATVLRLVVTRVLAAARFDERVGSQVEETEPRQVPLSRTIGETVYWLVFLLFLPAILSALALQGLLLPVQGMVDEILGFLPNLFAAGLILLVGWFVARIVSRIVTNLLAAVGVDRLSERVGLTSALGQMRLSGIVGLLVYVLILIPVIVASLNALGLEAVTQPVSNMLNALLAALPNIFAAVLLLVLAYVVGRVVAGLVSSLLAAVGFNRVPARLGLGRAAAVGVRTPSQVVGAVVLAAIMLFASMEAARLLGFGLLADLIARFTVFASQVVLGLIVFAIGLYLAGLAAEAVRASGVSQAGVLALAARIAIIVLAGAMALGEMGVAQEIVNLAFGLLLGAVAVAAALAFGLGGRDFASRQLENWRRSLEGDGPPPTRDRI